MVSGSIAPLILNLATTWGERLGSDPLYPKPPVPLEIGGWVGPDTLLGAVEEREKSLSLAGNQTLFSIISSQ
jgi:hypothetical protein